LGGGSAIYVESEGENPKTSSRPLEVENGEKNGTSKKNDKTNEKKKAISDKRVSTGQLPCM